MLDPDLLILAAIVLGAHLIGGATGFGSAVLSLTLAVHFFPIDFLVPMLIPLNLVLYGYLALRHRAEVERSLLLKRILPLCGLGMPLGWLVFQLGDSQQLKFAFGLFVLALALFEIARTLRRSAPADRTSAPGGPLWLLGGGVVMGLWVSGGPLIVYWTSYALRDKGRFRATLSALWLLLNLALLVAHLASGRLDLEVARTSALLLPALAVGAAIGEALHGRLGERGFRMLVYLVLAAAGGSIVVLG